MTPLANLAPARVPVSAPQRVPIHLHLRLTRSLEWEIGVLDIEPGSAAESANYAGDENLRLDLICGHDFYLRLSLVKLDCAGNADDFPLERGDMRVGRNF